jgi:EpsI family protein
MNRMQISVKSWILMASMLCAAALAAAFHPQVSMADQRAKVDLATLIPRQFGDWRELDQSSRQIVNPQQTAELEKLYSQTLSRAYINTNGAVIMLSIAYGADQSRDLQIHRPEVCYSAQGFQILTAEKTTLANASNPIPAMQLVAKQGPRNEPITYWVRIGEKIVRGNIEQGTVRLSYGLSGYIPDGVLFRVSSISTINKTAFNIQEAFIADMLQAVPPATKSYLLGQQI